MVFIEIDLNIGFPMFSRVTCLGMPYLGYGCISCFIPEILVYGTLVFDLFRAFGVLSRVLKLAALS